MFFHYDCFLFKFYTSCKSVSFLSSYFVYRFSAYLLHLYSSFFLKIFLPTWTYFCCLLVSYILHHFLVLPTVSLSLCWKFTKSSTFFLVFLQDDFFCCCCSRFLWGVLDLFWSFLFTKYDCFLYKFYTSWQRAFFSVPLFLLSFLFITAKSALKKKLWKKKKSRLISRIYICVFRFTKSRHWSRLEKEENVYALF